MYTFIHLCILSLSESKIYSTYSIKIKIYLLISSVINFNFNWISRVNFWFWQAKNAKVNKSIQCFILNGLLKVINYDTIMSLQKNWDLINIFLIKELFQFLNISGDRKRIYLFIRQSNFELNRSLSIIAYNLNTFIKLYYISSFIEIIYV